MGKADMVTGLCALMGVFAITYFIDGFWEVGVSLVLVGVILDGLDGRLARMFREESVKGQYMDIVADTITFCVAPAIMVYSRYYDIERGTAWFNPPNMLVMISCSALVLSGVYRLKRNLEGTYERGYFDGLPAPASAILVVCMVLIVDNYLIGATVGIVASFLMISRIPYVQLRGITGIVGGLYVVGTIISVWFGLVFIALSGYIAVYIIGSPIYWSSRTD